MKQRRLFSLSFTLMGAFALAPLAVSVLAQDQVLRELKDRKSTRLNSSHLGSSYAVFCLKKKKKVKLSTNLTSHFFDLVTGKILKSRLRLSKHLAHNLGNMLLLGKIGVIHNSSNARCSLF